MKKENFDDAISMFDTPDESGETEKSETSVLNNGRIDVVKMEYLGTETVCWQELFSGFDSLRAITFSSGINFVYSLLDMFSTAEVIFGCENVMSGSISEIMAYQELFLEAMREKAGEKRARLLDKITDGSVRFYVARDKMSHEKIYLLKSADGRKRVIMGSANMSYRAFSGVQRENICYVDGDAAYEWYNEVFERLCESSTDSISHKAFELADANENIDLLPISETVCVKHTLVIEPSAESTENIQFILDTKNLAKSLAPAMPPVDKKKKTILLTADKITRIRADRVQQHQEEEKIKQEYPQLVVDVFNKKAVLNNSPLDLHPSPDDIRKDVGLFVLYMNSFDKFHGETQALQERYYEFANWFFCSPFMAVMRDLAAKYNQQKTPYPVFGLICGQSKAGKTSFMMTLLKMMIGQMPFISAPDFTRTSIDNLKRTVQGAPIIVDDVTQDRFRTHAVETIKNENFGIAEHLTNYPAVVFSANNDVKAVAPEVTRRSVICRACAGRTNSEAMNSNTVAKIQNNIGTAFYREYLRRMMEAVPNLIEQLKDEDAETAPDILKCSADILMALFSEYAEEIPPYIHSLSLEDYFNEKKTGRQAITTIQRAWRINRNAFVVDKKMNELRYNAGQGYEAERIIKELPETLEARISREWLVMNLDEANIFFDTKFTRRRLFGG